LNGLRAYKINADSAIRKLRNNQKALQDRVKQQEKEINEKDQKLVSAARRIKVIQAGTGPKGYDEIGSNSKKQMMVSDVRHLVDENLKLKKMMEDIKEEYQIRKRALETNLEDLMNENRSLKSIESEDIHQEAKNSTSNVTADSRGAGSSDDAYKKLEVKLLAEKKNREVSEGKFQDLEKDFMRMVHKMKSEGHQINQLRDQNESQAREIKDLRVALESKEQEFKRISERASNDEQKKSSNEESGKHSERPEESEELKHLRERLESLSKENEKLNKENQMLTWERIDLKDELERTKAKVEQAEEGQIEQTEEDQRTDDKGGVSEHKNENGNPGYDSRQKRIEELRLVLVQRDSAIKELKDKNEALKYEAFKRKRQIKSLKDKQEAMKKEYEQQQQREDESNKEDGPSGPQGGPAGEISKSENTDYRIRLAKTQDKLLQLRNAYGALQMQQNELKRCLHEKNAIIETMVTQESVEDKFKALKKKTSQISDSFAKTQSELIEKAKELESYQRELRFLRKNNEKLQGSTEATRTSLNETILSLRAENEGLKAKNTTLQTELETIRKEFQAVQALNGEQTEALKNAKKKISDLELKWEDEMKVRLRFEKSSEEFKAKLQRSNKCIAESEERSKNQDVQIKNLLMKQKIEQKKNTQLTRDLKKALKKDAVKATETKAELALEVDKRQALEAKLNKANAKIKHMQKRLLVQSSLGHFNADSKDLSVQAKTVLHGVTKMLETTVRRLLEYQNAHKEQSFETSVPPLPPPPVPSGPKPNTPQAEFVDAIASRYEATMQREHVYQERMKYLQESVRLLQDDCEKKKIIIQNFMLDTAREAGSDFKSKFDGTPEEFRELLLQKLEVVLQDAIVQNIRLRDQLASLMRKNTDMRVQDKKLKQTIVACRHVILKLRAAVSVSPKQIGSDSKDSDLGILDAADALDVSAPDETSAQAKEAMAQIELLDASLADAQKVTETKSSLDPQTVASPSISRDNDIARIEVNSEPIVPSKQVDDLPAEDAVAIEENQNSLLVQSDNDDDPPVAEVPAPSPVDDEDDGPEVLEIPS